MINTKSVYFNVKQVDFIKAPQKSKVFIGGRGSGKSYTIGGNSGVRIPYMPKAKYGLVSVTMQHLKNNVVPSMMRAIKSMGYQEGEKGHFVRFKRPPAHWPEPWEKPDDYSDIITFNNGYTIDLVSTAKGHNADIIRGKNFDGLDIDEAAMGMDKEIYDSAIMPTVRGNNHIYAGNPFHGQIGFYTSMPWLSSGKWLLAYEQLMAKYPKDVYFTKCTSWDNQAVLGLNTLERWQREMNQLEYDVEIMCEEADSVPNSYYLDYDEEKHGYTNPLYTKFYDLEASKPLLLSFDFNAGFNSMIVGQLLPQRLNIVSESFVKGTKIIDHLIEQFDREFADWENPRVQIFGDSNGYKRNPNSTETFYDLILRLLRQKGWQPELKAWNYNPEHITRHRVINKLLQENENHPRIRINTRECPYLATNLKKTPIFPDFQKDKRSEKDENLPQEQATHLSDCFDYLVYVCLHNYVEPGYHQIEKPEFW
ncbi:hypothetical protein [Flexithrix dorotheae]|uniref:hypothetical protein n=1 Tax=Flexithrix dorotheae TaxID=70993 RepID=UPI0003754B95|nr:hypothetical protein [Flexithrix dorotheae]